jgi:Domain of unknown function (DUF6457)
MADWIDSLARELGVDPLTPDETQRLLEASREVAHRTERRITPLSTFLLGMGVNERIRAGARRDLAFDQVLNEVTALLPEAPSDGRDGQTEVSS